MRRAKHNLKKAIIIIMIALSAYAPKAFAKRAQQQDPMGISIAKQVKQEHKKLKFLMKGVKKLKSSKFSEKELNNVLDALEAEIRLLEEKIESRDEYGRLSEAKLLDVLKEEGLSGEEAKQKLEAMRESLREEEEATKDQVNNLKALYRLFVKIHHFSVDERGIEQCVKKGDIKHLLDYFNDIMNTYRSVKSFGEDITNPTLKKGVRLLLRYLHDEISYDLLMAHRTIMSKKGPHVSEWQNEIYVLLRHTLLHSSGEFSRELTEIHDECQSALGF
jgi:hypothetical protein